MSCCICGRPSCRPCPAAAVVVLAIPHSPSEPQPAAGWSQGHGDLAPHTGSTEMGLFHEVSQPGTCMLSSSDGLLEVTLCLGDWGLRCAATHFLGARADARPRGSNHAFFLLCALCSA